MAYSFTPSWSGRLALASLALIALLAGWLLLRLVWLLLAGPEVASAPVPPVPRVAPQTTSGGEFRWDLFGVGQRAPVAAPVAASSRSSLRLVGVMSGSPLAWAIISDGQGRESVYRPGDELPDGSVLESIAPQRVILSRGGRAEALELDDRRAATASAPASGATAVSAVAVDRLPGLRGIDSGAGLSMASFAGQTSAADLGALAQSISVMPVSSGGFRVRPGRDARLFSALGLQINDVVTAVNGQPLDSEEAARALFSDVLRAGEVAITVNRQGRELTLRPELDQIIRSLPNP